MGQIVPRCGRYRPIPVSYTHLLLEAYITNLGKYAEGQLVGETLKFPTTAEEVQSLLKRIGVDGIRYEEIYITSFDGDVLGPVSYTHLGDIAQLPLGIHINPAPLFPYFMQKKEIW